MKKAHCVTLSVFVVLLSHSSDCVVVIIITIFITGLYFELSATKTERQNCALYADDTLTIDVALHEILLASFQQMEM